MSDALARLRRYMERVTDFKAAEAVLSWDQETYMPPGAIDSRAAQLTTLARMAHEEFVAEETAALLDAAEAEAGGLDYDGDAASFLRVTRRDHDRATKIPPDLVARLASAASLGQRAWQESREADDFAGFRPHLAEILELTIEKAELLGYDKRIYDPLLDEFEPGARTSRIEAVFGDLREQLVPLVGELGGGGSGGSDSAFSFLEAGYDDDAQWDFGVAVISDFGFDFERGRQDRSAHPFTTSFSTTDVRLTTRIHENFLPAGLFGTLHECGHGLYEQGVAADLDRTPLAGGASLGVHESQSRLWEILVGRSRPFWERYYTALQEVFSDQLADVPLDTFYRGINRVCPSLIRVEADEVTYNLHIMLRFELENALLERRISVADLPEAWNEGMERYLGIVPANDADGVLQDIHWSMGAIGYFPTYSLGNLMSAQIFARAETELDDLYGQIAAGDFADLHNWLRDRIYRHGRKFTASELLGRMGCGELSAEPWLAYIRDKYAAS